VSFAERQLSMRVWPILNSALHSNGIDEDHPALVTSHASRLWLNASDRRPVRLFRLAIVAPGTGKHGLGFREQDRPADFFSQTWNLATGERLEAKGWGQLSYRSVFHV
jgi:hypothetical protein